MGRSNAAVERARFTEELIIVILKENEAGFCVADLVPQAQLTMRRSTVSLSRSRA